VTDAADDRGPASSVRVFFALLVLLSIPFWLLGAVAQDFVRQKIPIDLPISALMAFNPLLAALILVYRQHGPDGAKALLRRAVDFGKIERKIWYVPVIFLWPVAMVLTYEIMRLTGAPLPEPRVSVMAVAVLFVMFVAGAAGEELGWSGYVIDRLQHRWTALVAGIFLGAVWALWHVPGLLQTRHTASWIAWQCLGMVPFRVLIVWLYENTGKSVFAATLFHAMSNVSQFSFPNYGSHYDPFITALILTGMAVMVTFMWGPETLARPHRTSAADLDG
jgi:uncharacterized protein